MMTPEDQLDELLAEMTALYQRAKGGERGKRIVRDLQDVRRRIENVEVDLE